MTTTTLPPTQRRILVEMFRWYHDGRRTPSSRRFGVADFTIANRLGMRSTPTGAFRVLVERGLITRAGGLRFRLTTRGRELAAALAEEESR